MAEDIAVIGLGLRFPGDAIDPESLWKVLELGQSQWSDIPKERLSVDGYFHPSGDRQGSISFRGAHLLKGDVGAFDATFFSIPSEDAKAIDPQQRILLEVCYEALENAGLRKEDVYGSDTSVYVGSFVKDYEQVCLRDPDWSPQYAATGNGIAIMANRISYFFNFHGPSMTVDTGCSGSLVSVHLGAQSLRNRESSIAIAAGAGMILTPSTMMPMTALNFLSPDGKCFTFDKRANGYGRGEGIGVIVMKRLSDALRDNDTIRAVIRGTSVNQDGRTTGITLPSKEAQVANIRSVYASAGLDFDQTAYVECHGTGTQAGDWRELKAISETLGACRDAQKPIVVGSIKPNIGHLEGAAGVAGMIKGVMVLEKGKIPPNINFQSGNPDIDFQAWKVKVPTSIMDWPLPGLRRVSVNCFGFGGTNAHVILDEALGYLQSRCLKGHHSSSNGEPSDPGTSVPLPPDEYRLFCYSAHEKPGVSRIMKSHSEYIKSQTKELSPDFLMNYSYTLACRRSNLEWKGFFVAKSVAEVAAKLETPESSQTVRSLRKEKPRIGFVFCGQGTQWARMGHDLMQFEVFRSSLEEATEYLMHSLQSPFNLIREVLRDESDSAISYPHIAQPATTAIQVALVDLLQTFGVQPTNVVGHSSGEIAAAYAGGAISRFQAWEIAYFRGLAAISMPFRAPKLRGAMMVVGMSADEARKYLEDGGRSAEVACVNSPESTTISGRVEAIDAISEDLSKREQKVFHRILEVQTAYHSSHMRLVECDYRDSLISIKPRDLHPAVKMFSSVTGEAIQGAQLGPHYWSDNMVSPVQYAAAIRAMMKQPAEMCPDILIELGPRAALRSPTTATVASVPGGLMPTYYSTMQPKCNGVLKLLSLVGDLWVQGCSLDMEQVTTLGTGQSLRCLSDLPPYSWNHSKAYWHESHLSVASRNRAYPRQDLIGAPTADSTPFEPRWRGFLRISENPWIQDHQVQKTIVYPAAGMVSMVLEGAKQIRSDMEGFLGYEISDMNILKAMIVPNTEHGLEVALNIKITTEFNGEMNHTAGHAFSIYSKHLGRDWEKHATGLIRFSQANGRPLATTATYQAQSDKLSNDCRNAMNPRELYEVLDTMGMNYGPTFQNISGIYKGNGGCVFNIGVPDTKSKMPSKFEYPHILHPATLDSMFHSLLAIDTTAMVPTFIKSLFVSTGVDQDGPKMFTGFATADRVGLQDASAKIVMKGCGMPNAQVVIDGLHLTALECSGPSEETFLPNFRNMCTEIVWKEDTAFNSSTEPMEQIGILAHKFPGLTVLQVGGTARNATKLLQILAPPQDETPSLSRFTLLEAKGSNTFTKTMKKVKGTAAEVFLERKTDVAEINSDYHLIVSFENSQVKIEDLKSRLKAGGILIQPTPLSPGGHSGANGNAKERHSVNAVVYKRPVALMDSDLPLILLTPKRANDEISAFVESLKSYKTESGQGYSVLAMTTQEVLNHASQVARSVVISLLDICPSTDECCSIMQWDELHFDLFADIQKSAKGIIWVTRGAHMKPHNNLEGSPIIGLARTLMSEDPRKMIVTFDLDAASNLADKIVIKNIMAVFSHTFCAEAGPDHPDMEFAEKDGKIFIPRLRPIKDLNQVIEGAMPPMFKTLPFRGEPKCIDDGANLKLAIIKAGLSANCRHYTKFQHGDILPDHVDIKFYQTLLAPNDVETALGRSRESTLGLDVRGIITRVGKDVGGFVPGNEVVALVSGGSVQRTVRVKAALVQRHKSGLFPSLLVSAYYALVHMGRARSGKSVLIHAGASAHGLAAIEIALLLGVNVYATVVGQDPEGQQKILEGCGISPDMIFRAEDDFPPCVLEKTAGHGVDIVYSTTTQHHTNSVEKCVKSCGFIVQLAASNPHGQGQKTSLTNNATVVNFDLPNLLREDSEFVAELLESAYRLLNKKQFTGSVCTSATTDYGIGVLDEALKHVQSTPYQGRCTISAGSGVEQTVNVLCGDQSKSLRDSIDPDGTYLLAGGLGGLGRSISTLLIANGAKHLAFVSRSGASNNQSRAFIEDLQNSGTNANVYQADLCDEASLAAVVDKISVEMPPLRGVFQCAAVIQDSVFDNMTYPVWDAAFKPKTQGSWNLVKTMAHSDSKPFFVFLASSAGVIGNRGQANYAAGNSFIDALAHHCRLQGVRAVSIDLGPVLGAGMLAEDDDMLDKLRAAGFYGIRHEDFLTVVKHAVTMEIGPRGIPMPAQVILGVGTGGLLRQNKPADPYWSRTALYSYLNLIDMPPPNLDGADDLHSMDMKTLLARCSNTDSAVDLIQAGLANMLAKAMNLLPEEVDVNKPPNAYGVDSLVAVGVRNWVLSNCAVEVSVFEVLSNDTILDMARTIANRRGYGKA